MITIDNRRVVVALLAFVWSGYVITISALWAPAQLGTMMAGAGTLLGIIITGVLGADAYDMRQRRLDPSTLASQIAATNGVSVPPDHGTPPGGPP